MNARNLLKSIIYLLSAGAALGACSSDDGDENWNNGAAEVLPKHRVFVLNEGIYGMNNATLTFYDPSSQRVVDDIYAVQNGGQKLGDTAQDLLAVGDEMYIVMNGSNYISRLSGAGVELARYGFTEEQGQPRYVAALGGKVYVTLYSGNVMRLDAKTLQPEKMVQVGNNPEQIVAKDGVLYCVNSGWGADNRLSIIDTHTFDSARHVEIFPNLQRIANVGGQLVIQGYGAAYPHPFTYPVVHYNADTRTCTSVGQGTHLASYGTMLYVAFCYSPDYVNYTTEFYTYNTLTGEKSEGSFLKDAPDEVVKGNVYMLEIDPSTGDIYVGITHYEAGNGDIYHFRADGTLVRRFESGGQSPNAMAFFD